MTKPVIVKKMENLISEVEQVLSTRKVGQKNKAEFEEARKKLQESVVALNTLHDICDLDDLETEIHGRKQNHEYWKKLQSGRYASAVNEGASEEILRRKETLASLVKENSITLGALRKAQLEILAITKFSDQELAFAEAFGQNFKELKITWENFKRTQSTRQPVFARIHTYFKVKEFFDLLKNHQVIQSYSLRLVSPTNDFVEITDLEMREHFKNKSLSKEHRIEFHSVELNTKMLPLVTGHWFEAFTGRVFEKALDSLASEYELYTRVDFQAISPLKGIEARSDFDLLVGLPDEFMMVECKSGALSSVDVKKMCGYADFLKTEFQKMGIKKFLFMLVFSPTDDREQIPQLEELVRNKFIVIEPYNVAAYLNRQIQGQEIDPSLIWSREKVLGAENA